MIGNLNHVAIAVPDLNAAIAQYEGVFGAFVTTPQDLAKHGVRVAVVNLSNTKVELMTPLGDTSPLTKFLEKHPQGGIHHLCYEVPDVIAARDQLMTTGIQVIGDGTPHLGYNKNPVLFFTPKDCLGVLIELEEISPSKSQGRVDIQRLETFHTFRQSKVDSLEGVDGVGVRVEADFKHSTPPDNKEEN